MCNALRVVGIAKQVLHPKTSAGDADVQMRSNENAGLNEKNCCSSNTISTVIGEKNLSHSIVNSSKNTVSVFNPYAKKSNDIAVVTTEPTLKLMSTTLNTSKENGSTLHNQTIIPDRKTMATIFNPYAKKRPLPLPTGQDQSSAVPKQNPNTNIPLSPSVQISNHINPISIEPPCKHLQDNFQKNTTYRSQTHIESHQFVRQRLSDTHPAPNRNIPQHVKTSKAQKTLSFFSGVQNHDQKVTQINTPIDDYTPGPVPICEETQSTWIYPQSAVFTERKYQLSISETAIMYDTLVSLPTGLGKTLIASVVMYNFYRWFPTGKVVFLAPTRPLVTQQIEACFNIMGIPESDTAEMSGKNKPENRERLWKSRRCFFCTPQTFEKDLEEGRCDAKLVTCLVLDEAHKATGSYAYVNVVNYLHNKGVRFRLLGLSATPGKDLRSIRKVIETLRVSKIEARVEDDDEVKPYTYHKEVEIIKITPTSVAQSIDALFDKIIGPRLQQLRERNQMGAYRGSDSNISSYHLLQCMQQRQGLGDKSMMHHFVVIQSLLRAREALRNVGIGFAGSKIMQFITDHGNRGLGGAIVKEEAFLQLKRMLVDPQGKDQDLRMNNPKLQMLDVVLHEHFARSEATGESSRAIVFSQWRGSVEEIVSVLQGSELVRPSKFVGQGSGSAVEQEYSVSIKQKKVNNEGMNQKEQQRVLQEFRKGSFNCLVCTCIGEEGLDIGDVDLIVHFDCLSSPIRMIQRAGRTGRKRKGRVVVLVLKGPEELKLEKSEQMKKRLWRALRDPSSFKLSKPISILPSQPLLKRQTMNVSKSYRLSQIGGYSHRKRQRCSNDDASSRDWWLSEEQELQRLRQFGELAQFDPNIRRLYIKKNLLKACKGFRETTSSRILLHLEEKYSSSRKIIDVLQKGEIWRTHQNRLATSKFKGTSHPEIYPSHSEKSDSSDNPICFSPTIETFENIVGEKSQNQELTTFSSSVVVSSPENDLEAVFGPRKIYTYVSEAVLSVVFSSKKVLSIPSMNIDQSKSSVKPAHEVEQTIHHARNESENEEKLNGNELINIHSSQFTTARLKRNSEEIAGASTISDYQSIDKIEPCLPDLKESDHAAQTIKNQYSEVSSPKDTQTPINCVYLQTPNEKKISSCMSEKGHTDHTLPEAIETISVGKGDNHMTDSPIHIRKSKPRKHNQSKDSVEDLIDTPLETHSSRYSRLKRNISPGALTDTPSSEIQVSSTSNPSYVEPLACDNSWKKRKMVNIDKLRIPDGVRRFFDLEASASECDDEDEDDEHLSQDSFINDSSQLGYTQGGLLSSVDHSNTQSSKKGDRNSMSMYRRINNMRNRSDLFCTPLLNRRSKTADLSCPSSDVHLGKMTFIRSVIEHHKNGGDADEIEEEYHAILRGTNDAVNSPDSNPNNISEVSLKPPPRKPPINLSADQLARIEQNRRNALLRREALAKNRKL